MKFFTSLFLVLMSILCSSQAQPILYGSMGTGHSLGKYDVERNELTTVLQLDNETWMPGFTDGRDGLHYGISGVGGAYGKGFIASFNPGTQKFSVLYPFNSERESSVADGLVQADNGKLYGLTAFDGSGNRGVIFSYDPDKSLYVIEKSLDHNLWPTAPFSLGKDGILYSIINREFYVGTYPNGEWKSENWIFSFNPTTNEYKELTKLCCGDLYNAFTPSSDGKLYAFRGEIVSYDPVANKIELIPYPGLNSSKLVEGAHHKLYGISSPGSGGPDIYGTIFSFDPSDKSFTKLFSFENQIGFNPLSGMVYAADGKLYGTTREGGMYNKGIVYSFDPKKRSFEVLRHLDESLFGFLELDITTPPLVSITNEKLYEGETAELTVSLNHISKKEIALKYRTIAGTATNAGAHPDFSPASGEVIIPAGEISASISVSLLADELLEIEEDFTVVLQRTNKAHVQLGDSVGRIYILNGIRPIIPPGGEIITIPPMTSNAIERVVKDELLIRATPNPSSDFFTLHITGNNTDRVSVTVTNLSGQILNKFDGAFKNYELVFGQNYQSGAYFVRIVDGKKSRVIKLVKTK